MRGQLQLIAERFTPLSSDIPSQTNFGCMFRIISSQPEAVLLPSLIIFLYIVKKLMPGETERTNWVGSFRIQMKKLILGVLFMVNMFIISTLLQVKVLCLENRTNE